MRSFGQWSDGFARAVNLIVWCDGGRPKSYSIDAAQNYNYFIMYLECIGIFFISVSVLCWAALCCAVFVSVVTLIILLLHLNSCVSFMFFFCVFYSISCCTCGNVLHIHIIYLFIFWFLVARFRFAELFLFCVRSFAASPATIILCNIVRSLCCAIFLLRLFLFCFVFLFFGVFHRTIFHWFKWPCS